MKGSQGGGGGGGGLEFSLELFLSLALPSAKDTYQAQRDPGSTVPSSFNSAAFAERSRAGSYITVEDGS